MDPLSFFSGLISTGANLWMTDRTNQLQEKLAGQQMQFQHDEAEISRKWQEQMQDKMNAYNSAPEQMRRLMEAGLNPYLLSGSNIVGEGTAANPPSGAQAGSTSLPVTHAGYIDPLMMAQISKLDAETEEILSQIPVNRQKVAESVARIKDLLASVDQRRSSVVSYLASAKLSDAQRENISFEQMVKRADLGLQWQRLGMDMKLSEAEIKRKNAESESLLARAKVSQREYQELIYTFAIRKAGLEKQNLLTDAMISQANATADKLIKEGIRIDQMVDIDKPASDRARRMYNMANSDNPIDYFGGQFMYAVDYAADHLLGFLK